MAQATVNFRKALAGLTTEEIAEKAKRGPARSYRERSFVR